MAKFYNGALRYDIEDAQNGVIPGTLVGTVVPDAAPEVWVFDDYAKGLCSREQIDKPKASVLPPIDLLKEVPARRIKQDVMDAYHNLGGSQWLEKLGKSSPELFAKFALKILPQTVEQDVRMELTNVTDLSQLSTNDLKLMLLKQAALEQEKDDDPPL